MIRSDQEGLTSRLPEIAEHFSALPEVPLDSRIGSFLEEPRLIPALLKWFGSRSLKNLPRGTASLRNRLSADIGRLDELINAQLNAILHHPDFQKLEASWRGLAWLVSQKPERANIRIRVLDMSWKEVARDAERAIEFDQTELFRKVYESEFGMPGGKPFGVLLGDYTVSHRISRQHPIDDVATLRSVATVAASAFSPFLVAAHPNLFGADEFSDLDRRLDLERMFQQLEYTKWRSFADSDDARYVGLCLPRILMRRPWQRCTARIDQYPFEEQSSGRQGRQYLWGNPVYSFGAAAMRTFAESGWFEHVLGARRDTEHGPGGRIDTLPRDAFATDAGLTAEKFPTEIVIADEIERDLAAHGFMALCRCKYTGKAAFHSAASLHRMARFTNPAATRNEELSSRLHLMMCVARFAHYIKVIVRDQTGRFDSPTALETHLHNWIHQYVSADTTIAPGARTRYPLREATIEIREMTGQPGNWLCVAHLRPHVQGDLAMASMKLMTELPAGQVGSVAPSVARSA